MDKKLTIGLGSLLVAAIVLLRYFLEKKPL